MRSRIAVLASGGGTNLEAILDHFDGLGEERGGDVVVVASDRARGGALDRAVARGVSTATLPATDESHARSLISLLDEHGVDLIALAGYLRLVPTEIVRHYQGRIVNVHPALLPAFGGAGMYGRRVHQAVLDAGATVTGVTIHVVDDEYDRGPILAQWPVPVLAGDDAATLAARVLRVEHILYPRVLDRLARGGGPHSFRVAPSDDAGAFTLVSRDDVCLAEAIERALGR